ncbi:P2Y purinoceptor 8-like isoform X1 [Hydractinia symbiolongicarpus]|uniref:P2Y purinoceptor 8-like isoform X1 n=1 Tax=Hydractinia symbiolongicarpus TaxID=13093 RepID=UPI00254D0FEF|nr:P2Y purinoceptor 8-like isoform X1 [Hydractinia symbiolongicarpus]
MKNSSIILKIINGIEVAPTLKNSSSVGTICDIYGVEVVSTLNFHLPLSILVTVISFLTTVLNGIYIVVMCRSKCKLSLSNLLYLMLAITDISAGAMLMPVYSTHWIYALYEGTNCAMLEYVNVVGHALATVSAAAIAFITVDLGVSITYPFFYERTFTRKRLLFVNVATWFISLATPICFIVISSKHWYVYQNISTGIAIFVVFTLCLMHLKIYKEIKKLSVKINYNDNTQINRLKMRRKSIKLGTFILLTFSLCFLPLCLCFVYSVTVGNSSTFVSYTQQAAICIIFLNPMLDPFVYYFRLNTIRKKVRQLFLSSVENEGQTTCKT